MEIPKRRKLGFCALLVVAAAAVTEAVGLWAQTGAGRISGVVTDARNEQPLVRVLVTATDSLSNYRSSVLTDSLGAFDFEVPAPGRFQVTLLKVGFLPTAVGSDRIGGTGVPLVISAGRSVKSKVRMLRAAVIEGHVRDEFGRPVPAVVVRCVKVGSVFDRRPIMVSEPVVTDSGGSFRMFGLAPGHYVVAARSKSSGGAVQVRSDQEIDGLLRALSMASPDAVAPQRHQAATAANSSTLDGAGGNIYYPGTPSYPAAEVVELSVGEERLGVDVSLSRVEAATIEGRVLASESIDTSWTAFAIESRAPLPPFATFSPVIVERPLANGSFRIAGVPAGQYTLTVRGKVPDGSSVGELFGAFAAGGAIEGYRFASADLDVVAGGKVDTLLQLQPGGKVTGHVAFDDTSKTPVQDVRLRLTPLGKTGVRLVNSIGLGPAFSEMRPILVNGKGMFTVLGIAPGRYQLTLVDGAAGPWQLLSAASGTDDILEDGLVVKAGTTQALTLVLTQGHTLLTGRLLGQDPAGSEFTAVVFPEVQRVGTVPPRRLRAVRLSSDASYEMRDLPAGVYRLALVRGEVLAAELDDSAFISSLVQQSVQVRISHGKTTVQDLRLKR